MTQQDKEQLKLEIDHIFESGANEIRIFEMVVSFIDSRNGVNKNFVLADVNRTLVDFCQSMQCQFIHDHQLSVSDGVDEYLKSINLR